jgi:hypothetical protein
LNYYNYFSDIEETFIRRRGRNLLLSPLDWALIETWQERGVPLHIILRGIENVFDAYDKNPNKRRTIKSLTYCKEEIEAQYAEWLETQVGKNGVSNTENTESKIESPEKSELFSDEIISEHLERISSELKSAKEYCEGELYEVLEKVFKGVNGLQNKNYSAEKLEENLEKLDALIDEVLLKSFVTEKLKAETTRKIAEYQTKMEREVYERTFKLMLLKRLREDKEIPRLSLFYL